MPFITFSLVFETSWECAPRTRPRPAPTQPSFSVVFIQNQNTGKNKRDLLKIRTRITGNRRVSILAYVIYVISLLVQDVQGIKLNAESLS